MMHSNETTQVEALTTRISLLMARLEQLVQTVENLEAKAKDAEEEKFYDINDLARILIGPPEPFSTGAPQANCR